MTDNDKKFKTVMIWKKTDDLLSNLVEKKGFSIAKTVHEIIETAHKRNFPDATDTIQK